MRHNRGKPDKVLEKREQPKREVFQTYDEAREFLEKKLKKCHKADLVEYVTEMLCYQLADEHQVYECILGLDIQIYQKEQAENA
jgi:hypothetical protein